jgi:hypothetical protein
MEDWALQDKAVLQALVALVAVAECLCLVVVSMLFLQPDKVALVALVALVLQTLVEEGEEEVKEGLQYRQ